MPRGSNPFIFRACLLGLVVLLAGACTATASPPPSTLPAPSPSPAGVPEAAPRGDERSGGTLRYALGSDPGSIDPRFAADGDGLAVVDALFDSLVALDENLEVVPAAATDWVINDDGTVYEFRLREATFHNGEPVTAGAFVRAFTRLVDTTAQPRSFAGLALTDVEGYEAAAVGGPFTGIEALDEQRLRITLQRPVAEFLQMLAVPSLAPVPIVADEDPASFAQAPIGNGPFAMAGPWQRDEFVRVARYDDYRPAPALLDEVVFQIYAGDPTREDQWAEYEAGRLDFAQVPSERLDEAAAEFGTSEDGYSGPGVLDGLTTTLYYYGFNTERPPFDDPAVRQAISLLIDRERIVEEVTNDSRVVADAIVPPPLPAHQEQACPYCRFDPTAAAAMVAGLPEDVAWPDPLTIVHNRGRTHAAIADEIAGALETVLGVEVETRGQDLGPYLQSLREGEMGIFRLGWQASYPGAGSYLRPLFHSSMIGQDNLTRYRNPVVDRLLDAAQADFDPVTRTERFREAERRILADAAIAPVFVYRHNRVVAPDVRDFRFGPLGQADLARVWLASDPTA